MLKRFTIHERWRYRTHPFSSNRSANGEITNRSGFTVAPGHHADLLLALITSRTYQAIPNIDVIIEQSGANFAATGLKTSSVVRLTRLASVDPSVVNARLGSISADRLQLIRNRLVDWLQPS